MNREDNSIYVNLLRDFLHGELSAVDFEKKFRVAFLGDDRIFPQEVFEILNRVFTDGDAYVPDKELRRSRDLDEESYRASCRASYDRLVKLCSKEIGPS